MASISYVDNSVLAAKTALQSQIPDVSGFRKKTDKIAYSDITGHPTIPVIDEQLSNGTNAVQGKAILAKFNEMQDIIDALRTKIKAIPVSSISSPDGADVSFSDPLVSAFTVDFNKNFKITARFSIPKQGIRYILCGDYGGTNNCALNIEPYTDNHMRLFFNAYPDLKGLGPELKIDTIYNFEFVWTASARKCVAKLDGVEICNQVINQVTMVGPRPMVIGADYRGGQPSNFDAIKIYNFEAKFT